MADWLALVEAVLDDIPEPTRRSVATLVVGAVRGLILDHLTTGDTERIDVAMAHLGGVVRATLP